MTKEITKAHILQEIEDKFKLRELEPERFTFSENVLPIYNIEPHLGKWEVEHSTISITSMDTFSFFVVPPVERWTLRAYMVIFGATGAHKASGILVDTRPGAEDFIYLDLKAGQEISYLVNLPVPVILNGGARVRVFIDTYVSTQDLVLYADVLKETIR